jgi:HD-like signal output (HDOD) protein
MVRIRRYDARMDKQAIFKAIADDVAGRELSFSTSAQLALKVRQMLDDPDCAVDAVAKLIQAEPLLSARVVAMANSFTYNRSGRTIADARTAVARLGFSTLRTLATAVITRSLAQAQTAKAYPQLASQLWEHTAHVAALAQIVARRITKQDAETAMFVGIVHEIGGFYMISRAANYPGLLDDDMTDWVQTGEAEVGRAVLKVLGVPDLVVEAVEGYWSGYLAMPPVSLADTLLLAKALAPVASPLRNANDVAASEGMAASIEMLVGEETLSEILAESAEEVRSLTDALKF